MFFLLFFSAFLFSPVFTPCPRISLCFLFVPLTRSSPFGKTLFHFFFFSFFSHPPPFFDGSFCPCLSFIILFPRRFLPGQGSWHECTLILSLIRKWLHPPLPRFRPTNHFFLQLELSPIRFHCATLFLFSLLSTHQSSFSLPSRLPPPPALLPSRRGIKVSRVEICSENFKTLSPFDPGRLISRDERIYYCKITFVIFSSRDTSEYKRREINFTNNAQESSYPSAETKFFEGNEVGCQLDQSNLCV